MTFDPNTFLGQTVTGPLSTQVKPCPEGEFLFMVDSTPIGPNNVRSGKNDEGQPYYVISVPLICQDDAVKAKLGRDRVMVPYDCFLDLDATGALDASEGKNTKVGRLREVLGQNTDTNWAWSKLAGCGPFIGQVKHSPNKKDPENPFAKVERVTKIG